MADGGAGDERRDARLHGFIDRLTPGDRIALASMLRQSNDIGGRVPPHNEDAEAAVLSAIMLSSGRALDDVIDILPDGGAFYSDSHRRIYEVCLELHAKGEPSDIQTIANTLKLRDRLQAVGGVTYLAKIVDATPSVANVAAHARIIRDKHRVRQLIDTCLMLAADAHADYGTAETFLLGAIEQVSSIGERSLEARIQSVDEIGRLRDEELRAQWEGQRDPWGMRGPHARVHAVTHGHGIGEQTYVAADTGGGKSVYALQNALYLAGRQYCGETIGCGYLSLEMPSKRHYDRGLLHLVHPMAIETKFRPLSMRELQTGREDVTDSIGRLRGGDQPLDPARVWLLEQAQKKLRTLPIEFDDAGKDIAKVRATARVMQRRLREKGARLRLLVIDHMHIMNFPDARREDEAIAAMVKEFNEIAKDLELHLMVLAQFNRGAASTDGPPRKEHIRGAAAIEQIAHKIFLLYRPWTRMTFAQKAEASEDERREATLIVAKHRDGQEGDVPMTFFGEAFRFDEAADET